MHEREQQLTELQGKISKIDRALGNLGAVKEQVGTPDCIKRPDLNMEALSGMEYVNTAVAVGKIRKKIGSAIPILIGKREEAQRTIVQFKIQEIGELEQAGYLTPETAEKARQEASVYLRTSPEAESSSKPKAKAEQLPTEEGKEKLPRMKVFPVSKRVEVDGQVVKLRGKIEWEVFLYLARNANRDIPTEEIARVAKEAGCSARFPTGSNIWNIQDQFRPVLPNVIIRKGIARAAEYCLNADVVFAREGKKANKEKDSKDNKIKLPDGQMIEVAGRIRPKFLRIMLQTSEKRGATADDLAIAIYGKTDPKTREKIFSWKRVIGRELLPFDYRIAGQTVIKKTSGEKVRMYYLKKIDSSRVSKPLFESSILALNALVDFPNVSLPEIVNLLCASREDGRILSWNNVRFSLFKSIDRLRRRQSGHAVTDEESALWEKIKNSVDKDVQKLGDRSIADVFKLRVSAWFNERKPAAKSIVGDICDDGNDQQTMDTSTSNEVDLLDGHAVKVSSPKNEETQG